MSFLYFYLHAFVLHPFDLLEIGFTRLFYGRRPGVNFINVLQAAFTSADTKSTKRNWWFHRLVVLLGSAHVKAAWKNVDKIDPWLVLEQGYQVFGQTDELVWTMLFISKID
jgi:hypothetical protein